MIKTIKYKTFKGIIEKYECPFCGNKNKEFGKAVMYRVIPNGKSYLICQKCKKEWYEEKITIITKIVEKKDGSKKMLS